MAYTKRYDGRKFDELRQMKAEVGVVPRAQGSARFQIGDTIAIAAVYGPKSIHPKALKTPGQGILRCYYNMMSFAGAGNRVRPGPSRRSKEISLITENALMPALNLSVYGSSVVEVFIELLQTAAGTRCAGITAAAMALADAGFPMKDLVSAVAMGKIEDKLVTDVSNEEEHHKAGSTDIPIAIMPRTGKITLLQMDGYIKRDELKEVLKSAKKVCAHIHTIQREALKVRYKK